MAEAIELNFLENRPGGKEIDPRVQETLLDIKRDQDRITFSDELPTQYQLEQYYNEDPLGADVLKNKYLAPGENSPWQLWKRIAKAIASVETNKSSRETWEKKFFSILVDFRFVPGGRIMHGAGREDITTTLNNCYVVGIQSDSVQAIYESIVNEALTYKFGGGCGHDLSILRPSGSKINGTGGESCGPTGFMNLFSENTNTIAQHGRRGANMQTIRIDHPDVEKFIKIKTGDVNMVKYSNISVLLTHKFMEAVEADADFELTWGGDVYKVVKARDIWNTIIHHAHASAEPGLLFWDTMKEYHNAEYVSPLVSTNPCAEQPLPDGGCCNLGAINLERFVDEKGNFMIDEFKETARIATRFLDNVVDYNIDRHALPSQKQNAQNDRRVGLGILGLGDMLVKMGIRYDTEDALQTVDQVMQLFRDTIYETSIQIAKEKSPFPNFDWKGFSKSKFIKNLPKTLRTEIQENGIRNATLTTVAPTGSGAIVARVTSGIEPIFATSYKRRVKENDGYGKTFKEYKVYHPIIQKLFGDDSNLPDHVVTSHKIDPYFRVKMQGVIQKYIDSSISSTVNLPEDVSEEVVADIYMTAYKSGLKGITVYREGSREGILVTNKEETEKKEVEDAAQTANQAESVSATPRKRPNTTRGVTRRIRTGEGTLYVTINEDDDGLCEVFTTIGKAGGNAAAQSEAISRLISLALRSRINPREIIRQLKGISGPNPSWEEGRLILSTPDAIGKALDDYWKDSQQTPEKPERPREAKITFAEEPVKSIPHFSENSDAVCTEGNPMNCRNVVNEGGCLICRQCGWSKCE